VFGETVRAYRRGRGLSQEELTKAAGLSVRGIRKIEAGDSDDPRPATVRLLADALKLLAGKDIRLG
jgi:transcriptional regulator with XRE-family HTH domain